MPFWMAILIAAIVTLVIIEVLYVSIFWREDENDPDLDSTGGMPSPNLGDPRPPRH